MSKHLQTCLNLAYKVVECVKDCNASCLKISHNIESNLPELVQTCLDEPKLS